MTTIQNEALKRATTNASTANFQAIFEGFAEKGIKAYDILPRENVLTFQAWKAKGRSVQKGEKGVKVLTWIKNEKTGKMFPKTTTVFHVSQTKPTR